MLSHVTTPPYVLPIYYPTMTVFIDDEPLWLKALSTQLPDGLMFRCFDKPKIALQEINHSKDITLSPFSDYPDANNQLENMQAINFDLNHFSNALNNKDRFNGISVIVVDYHMPDMNGLEFCQQIKGKNIQKIMLTGAADENLAIDAFNDGIIDGFIKKHEKNLLNKLLPMIGTAKNDYFHSLSNSIDALKGIRMQFLHNEKFTQLFRDLYQQRGIVEYYVTAQPDGILMVDSKGGITLLATFTSNELQSQYEIARDQDAPQALLATLKNQKFCFWYGLDGFYAPQCTNWLASIYPIHRLSENADLFYTVIENWQGVSRSNILPYQAYLESVCHV